MTAFLHQRFFLCLFAFFCGCLYAAPPYMWYGTYSIENYDGNGDCGMVNLNRCHDFAEGFSIALEALDLPHTEHKIERKDNECTALCWTNESAEINNVDFVFYSGHGWGCGPIFGCNPGYPINCIDHIRFGGGGYLKWVQAISCMWFIPQEEEVCPTGLEVCARWNSSFKGVHAVMAHRARTWEHEYCQEMSEAFWNYWVNDSLPIYQAWEKAQIDWVYDTGACLPISPATLAPNEYYIEEKFDEATDDPAPYGAGAFRWKDAGEPIYW